MVPPLRIVAVVKPACLDAVMEALCPLGPADVLVEQVRGYGRQKGHLDAYEEGLGQGGFLPKVRLDFTVAPEMVDAVVEAVRRGARTGRIGDGKVFVQEVEPGPA